ncbi:MAG: hypothetical protein FD157_4155 [Rhodocyclaceae bacterium]|nr:MAG: hypothetical protein FD157_4155 [Rhodocyclaceae bacterium]
MQVREVCYRTADSDDLSGQRWVYFDQPCGVEIRVSGIAITSDAARLGNHIDRVLEDKIAAVESSIFADVGRAAARDDGYNDAVYNWSMQYIDPFLNVAAVTRTGKRFEPRIGRIGSGSSEASSRAQSVSTDSRAPSGSTTTLTDPLSITSMRSQAVPVPQPGPKKQTRRRKRSSPKEKQQDTSKITLPPPKITPKPAPKTLPQTKGGAGLGGRELTYQTVDYCGGVRQPAADRRQPTVDKRVLEKLENGKK